MENKIKINNINFSYRGNDKQLTDINLTILSGQCLAIVGKSGCGKSTLTRVINGLIPSFYQGYLDGDVFIDDKNLGELNTWEIGSFVGNVFQDPRSQFFANEVAGEIAFGCENLGLSHNEIVDRVHKSAKEMNILELLNTSIYTLSYGMRQRVAICSAIPPIRERIESVRQARLSGDKSAQKLAARAHQFRETNMPEKYTLVIPSVSSENRVYMQIGYVSKNFVVTNLAFAIYDAEPWVFGLISSKMHNLWIRTVCGGLETRLRYSNVLGYNTFPVPQLSDEQKQNIAEAALGVLVERENNSELSMMELYNPDTMPDGLKYAHKILDEVVESCYKAGGFISDQERLDEMFMLYKSLKEAK